MYLVIFLANSNLANLETAVNQRLKALRELRGEINIVRAELIWTGTTYVYHLIVQVS